MLYLYDLGKFYIYKILSTQKIVLIIVRLVTLFCNSEITEILSAVFKLSYTKPGRKNLSSVN